MASAYTATIEPNNWHTDGIYSNFALEPVYKVSFTWSSNVPLTLSVSGPSGLIKSYEPAMSGSGSSKTDDGSLYFTWLNTASASATLQYELTPMYQVEKALSDFFLGMLVVVAVIVIAVILLVFLVLRATGMLGRKHEAPMTPSTQPYGSVATPGTRMDRCPGCGTKVTPETSFCPNCGARLL